MRASAEQCLLGVVGQLHSQQLWLQAQGLQETELVNIPVWTEWGACEPSPLAEELSAVDGY